MGGRCPIRQQDLKREEGRAVGGGQRLGEGRWGINPHPSLLPGRGEKVLYNGKPLPFQQPAERVSYLSRGIHPPAIGRNALDLSRYDNLVSSQKSGLRGRHPTFPLLRVGSVRFAR